MSEKKDLNAVQVSARDKSGFTCDIDMAGHTIVADEPVPLGGADLGATPMQLLKAALGSCTTITLRMYAERKGWEVESLSVTVTHEKNADDEVVFNCLINLPVTLELTQKKRMLGIAKKCPIHKMVSHEHEVVVEQA